MRVLVCGGRGLRDSNLIYKTLNDLDKKDLVIIHGDAYGADFWARLWADEYGVPREEFKAFWSDAPGVAGSIRNARMLIEGKPTLLLAFPDPGMKNAGTKNMIFQARERKIEVRIYE